MRMTAAVTGALAIGLLAGCATDFEPVSGQVTSKWIEHEGNGQDECKLEVKDPASTLHVFEIDCNQWQTVAVNSQVNAKDLKAPTED